MRGHGTSVMPITAGCRKDIERLLKMYKEKETLRYKPFIELFEKMKFATIFMGRMSPAELYEFSEKLFQITISYAMSYRERKPAEYAEESTTDNEPMSLSDIRFSNEMTLQERMFGIYLTYVLYFVQPESYVAQVRVTPDQLADLIDFVNERLIPERHIDAFAALFKLINGGAFRIYAFEKEHNPLLHRRFDLRELDEGGLDEAETHEPSFLKALGDDVVLTQADIICKRYLAAKEKANLPVDSGINLVQTTISEIYNDILKSTEAEMEANSSPKKAPRQNSGRFRSALKEKAYKSHIVHARHRRYLVDPSVSSTNTETEQEQNMVSATQMLKTLKRYSISESEKDLESEDMDILLHSGEKQLNKSGSSTEASGTSKKLGKATKKGMSGRKRVRSKLSISEMSLAELTHGLGGSTAALSQEEREIENSKKERIADRLLEKIQKAQEKMNND
uniref:snRNA-activating protein complex subunit 1 n=1 Tax=Onchocerca volvulus TaxID=6282 RepID=A0A8R1XMQ2_ONCVO